MAFYACDLCNEFEACLMVTQIDNGETYTVCPNCLPSWLAAMLEQITGKTVKVIAPKQSTTKAKAAEETTDPGPEVPQETPEPEPAQQ